MFTTNRYRWRRITKATLPHLQSHYLAYEPYCHLNVVDLWSYRVGVNYWFQCGDTIAYTLSDYVDDSSYITVLGRHSLRETISVLCGLSRSDVLVLRCVPAQVAEALAGWDPVLQCEDDRDNHDYIFDIDELTRPDHPKAKSHRQFRRRFPNVRMTPLDHTVAADRRQLVAMFDTWISQTHPPDWRKERLALRRALNQTVAPLDCLAFMDGNHIIGYTINAAEDNGYYQAFFGKADRRYPNLTVFQEMETASYMKRMYASRYMNLQPDSGMCGLRSFKMSLRPTRMLPKFTLAIDVGSAQ